jgi:hypothetical protein
VTQEPSRRPTLGQVLKAGLRQPPKRPDSAHSDNASAAKRRLQAYQVDLLQSDYADFAAQPRYAAMVDFFFNAIYAPADFGLRNDSFRKLHDWLAAVAGEDPVQVLSNAIELYDLTEDLDEEMVAALAAQGTDGPLVREAWTAAFRQVGRPMDRHRQVELLEALGASLEKAARVPFVGAQLKAVRPAAALVGWGHVVDFLVEGQQALARAGSVEPLLAAIAQRETDRIEGLLGPHPEVLREE